MKAHDALLAKKPCLLTVSKDSKGTANVGIKLLESVDALSANALPERSLHAAWRVARGGRDSLTMLKLANLADGRLVSPRVASHWELKKSE